MNPIARETGEKREPDELNTRRTPDVPQTAAKDRRLYESSR